MRTSRLGCALRMVLLAAALGACQSHPAVPGAALYAGVYTGAREATGTEELTVKADGTFMEGYARVMRARGTWELAADRIIVGHNDPAAVTSRPPNARIYYLLNPANKTFTWANNLEELQAATRPALPRP